MDLPIPISGAPQESMDEASIEKPDRRPMILDPRDAWELMSPDVLEEIKGHLYSDDKILIHKAAQNIRRILSIEENPPIQMVIQAGLIPRLVELLQDDISPEIQWEAAWALTNVASGSADDTAVVVDSNACSHFIRLLRSSEIDDVREQCAWALGNVAGGSVAHRDLLLQMGALPALLTIFDDKRSRVSTIRNSTWTLSNLLRGRPVPSKDNIALALPYLTKLIRSDDPETVADACGALSYVTERSNDIIQMVLDRNIAPKLVELLNSGNPQLLAHALRIVGNITTGDDLQTDQVVKVGALHALSALLNHPLVSIRREACWSLSNITAGTKEQIEAVIQCDSIIPQLIEALGSAEAIVKKEACWAVANVTSNGTHDQIMQIAMAGAIPPLCGILSVPDSRVVKVALEGLDNILKAAKKHGNANNESTLFYHIVEKLHVCGAISTIKDLKEHASQSISERASDMFDDDFCHVLLTLDAMQYTGTKYE